jgi:hypothetical protein
MMKLLIIDLTKWKNSDEIIEFISLEVLTSTRSLLDDVERETVVTIIKSLFQ